MRDLSHELLEKVTTSLDELSVVIVLHLQIVDVDGHSDLLRDSWNVASGPAFVKDTLHGLKLFEPSLASPFTSFVAASDCVLGDLTHFDRVSDREGERSLLQLILMILACTLNLLCFTIESQDLRNQVRLGIVCSNKQVTIDRCRLMLLLFVHFVETCRVGWH